MRKENKSLKIIVVVMVILSIVNTIIYMVRSKQVAKKTQEEFLKANQEISEKYYSDKKLPQNVVSLKSKYKGELQREDYYRSVNAISIYIPELSSKIKNVSNLDKYYEENKNEIYVATGIRDKEEFKSLAELVKKIGFEKAEYEYSKIDRTSYLNTKEYLRFITTIKYKGKEEISLYTYFANAKKEDTPNVRYEVIGGEDE